MSSRPPNHSSRDGSGRPHHVLTPPAHGRLYRLPVVVCTACLLLASVPGYGQADAEQPADSHLPPPSKEFAPQIRRQAGEGYWVSRKPDIQLDRTILVQSVEAARAYMLNQMKAEGNFIYQYDVLLNTTADDDNQVRQAGSLWGLSSLNRDRPTDLTRRAVIRGLDFHFRNSKVIKIGQVAPCYPGARVVETGTVALVCLAIVELWSGQEEYMSTVGRGLYAGWLDRYLAYLQAMEMDNGSWGECYELDLNDRSPIASPYFDGEALLAYCRAARYAGHTELIPRIEAIAPLLAERYTSQAWKLEWDSNKTKGFFQWGCMAFAEYVEAGWKDSEMIGDAAMALAWWQIHEHELHKRRGNTGYAIEGILGAYSVARHRGDVAAMNRLRAVAGEILGKLVSWQVGGPLRKHNEFLRRHDGRIPIRAHGGIMSSRDSGIVRIDVVQHQVNATLMALDLLYPDTAAGE